MRQTVAIEPELLAGRADGNVIVAPDIESIPPAAFYAFDVGALEV